MTDFRMLRMTVERLTRDAAVHQFCNYQYPDQDKIGTVLGMNELSFYLFLEPVGNEGDGLVIRGP